MAASWKTFQMPKNIVCDEATATPTYGKFIADPFERGYGATFGNSLRRILLSSIEGTTITAVKIEGVMHEFSAIDGVVEDVAQLILNLKKIVLKVYGATPKTIYLKAANKEEVTAADLIIDETMELFNPDVHIATLSKGGVLNAELTVQKGRGYVPVDRVKLENLPIGVIAMDASFTPVTKVNFSVENARVGQITDYDRLILEIWTNGSIAPQDALLHAAEIAQRHFDIFKTFGTMDEEVAPTAETPDAGLSDKLSMPVSELDLSVRSANCLKEARIQTLGELVSKSELEMLKFRNFGKKSLAELNVLLQTMGLSFGMNLEPSDTITAKE